MTTETGSFEFDAREAFSDDDIAHAMRFIGTDSRVEARNWLEESEDDDFEDGYALDSFDDGEALASAGMGTDEDYGHFGDDY